MTDVEQSNFVTVGRAYGESEAALALALLDADGIEVFAHTWYTQSMMWHYTHALGGIELRVPAAQAARALDVLDGFQVEARCRNRLFRLLIAAAVFLLVGFPPPPSGFFVASVRPRPSRTYSLSGRLS